MNFWSWKIEKKVLESPGKVLEFFWAHDVRTLSGFVQVLEILESPGISGNHFPGLESPGILMQVLDSPGNQNWATSFY